MNDQFWTLGKECLLECIAQPGHALGTRSPFSLPNRKGGMHTDGQADRFGSWTKARLLKSALHERRERRAVSNEQHADADRAVKLVGTGRKGCYAKSTEINGQFSHDLNGIGMEGYSSRGTNGGQLLDWLQHSGLVVAEHDADQAGLWTKQCGEFFDLDDAFVGDSQSVEIKRLLFERLSRSDDGRMLDRGDDQMGRSLRAGVLDRLTESVRQAENRQVVRLGSAAGENDQIGLRAVEVGAQQPANSLAGLFQHLPSSPSSSMLAGRIRIAGGMTPRHRITHLGQNRRGGIVIEINVVHGQIVTDATPWRWRSCWDPGICYHTIAIVTFRPSLYHPRPLTRGLSRAGVGPHMCGTANSAAIYGSEEKRMEASSGMTARALITLAFLILVPLAAVVGTRFTGSVSAAKQAALPVNHPEVATPRPNTNVTGMARSDSPSRSVAPQAGEAAPSNIDAGPKADLAGKNPQNAPIHPRLTNSSASGPQTVVARAPIWNASQPDPARAAGIHGQPATVQMPLQSSPPTANAPSSGDAAMIDPFTWMQRRLRELGAIYYRLENGGPKGEIFRFQCQMAVPGSPSGVQPFEAIDADPLKAMQQVLQQVEAWHSKLAR